MEFVDEIKKLELLLNLIEIVSFYQRLFFDMNCLFIHYFQPLFYYPQKNK